MWQYYKKTFFPVQLFAVVISTMIYRATHSWAPVAVFFLSMQVSCLFGPLWTNQLRKKAQARSSCLMN